MAAANPSTSEAPQADRLIQIEEPASPDGTNPDGGLTVGLDFCGEVLSAACAIGGNAELIDDETLGTWRAAPGLAGVIAADPAVTASLTDCLQDFRRRLTAKSRRLVTHCVVVLPQAAGPASLAVIGAVEESGLGVLAVIDAGRAQATVDAAAPAQHARAIGAALLAEDMA